MADGKKRLNYLNFPLEMLWDDRVPTWLKVHLLTVTLGKEVNNKSLSNILGKSMSSIRDTAKYLKAKGYAKRSNGVSWLPESLPPVEEGDPHLKALRATWGRLGPKNVIPTPLAHNLEWKRQRALTGATWRISPLVLDWMKDHDLHEPPEFWAFQVRGLLNANPGKVEAIGTALARQAGEAIDPEEAVVIYVAHAVREAGQKSTVKSFGALYTTIFRSFVSGVKGEGPSLEKNNTTINSWVADLSENLFDIRLGVGDYLNNLLNTEK